MEESDQSCLPAVALIYLTFFLDNVLLTVLVPIIPDWVRGGEALELWAQHDAPLVTLLNSTVHQITHDEGSVGRAQATVGAVLGAKAAVQLGCAGPAATLVCNLGPAKVLRAATALLAVASLVFWACSVLFGAAGGGALLALCVCGGRALHGAGAALGGVAGLALTAALPPPAAERALPALLGAVALGVLVGYPFGGAATALWRPGTAFLLLAAVLTANYGIQTKVLNRPQYNMPAECSVDSPSSFGCSWLMRVARGAGGEGGDAVLACAGCVLLTTSVMAALEPCLPLYLAEHFGAARWQTGLAFVPDSAGYLIAASSLGGFARRTGAERVALTGQAMVGVAAWCVPLAWSALALAGPQLALGAGLGAVDAAVVPALLARVSRRRAAVRAALLQGASSAAYALGPVAGGAAAWLYGAPAALRALGLLNLLYAALLYRYLTLHPISEQWGAAAEPDSDDEGAEMGPLQYAPLR